jgi:hypothetical protein
MSQSQGLSAGDIDDGSDDGEEDNLESIREEVRGVVC